MKTTLTLCSAALLALATLAAQEPQQPSTTFRSTVDVVPVDVNVLGEDGRPLTGLTVDDFVLTVDGKPRRLVSAQYVSAGREPGQTPPTHYSSNSAAAGGRMIMLVVDQGNIGIGRGRTAMEAARKFIAQLAPSDRIGLTTIPGTGVQVDFTANHSAVSSLLLRVYGQASPPHLRHDMGLSEAFRIERGDRLAIQEVTSRVCAGLNNPTEMALCQNQVIVDAKTLHTVARERTTHSIMALRALIDRLSLTPSPKSLIFISEGLVVDREFSELTWLGPEAARAQVVIHVIQLEAPMFDATIARPSPTQSEDRSMLGEGLNILAGLTRGALMRAAASADFAFTRLGFELAAYYLLSFEPESTDRDGNSHKISVAIPNRKSVTVRARREFVVGGGRVKSAEELLVETLRAPLQASEIGLKLATYTLRDPGSTNRLRVLVSAEIDRSLNASESVALGFILVDSNGKVVGSQIEPALPRPSSRATQGQTYVGSVVADLPGVHTVKLAVVDGRGRRGSVERTFRAELMTRGQVRTTDLLIGQSSIRGAGAVLPAIAGDFTSDLLHGYLELSSEADDVLDGTKVTLEVASSEDGRALDSAQARLRPAEGNSSYRTAEAAVPIALLPPGEYVARAVITIDGREAGQVTRPFSVARTATAPGAGAEGEPAAPSRPPIPFASRIDRFDRSSVLTTPVVGFFIDRLKFGPGGSGSAAPALEHARAGRFDEAAAALTSTSDQQLAGVFLQGLALYAKGHLDKAAEKFRETLRLDSEFFTAAFYLGACLAASGRDREAVGAWQTSLVTESDAPFIYTLLGDALLRLRDVKGALDILSEAASIWPDSDQVQLRLGTALAMSGRADEAIKVLEPYLAQHPEDHERHFLVLQIIYEARAGGRSIKSPTEDRALFDRYAAAYVAAQGPQQAMVDTWRKFIERGGR